MSVTNNGTYDIVKISGENKLIEYNSNTNNLSVLTSEWIGGNKISFGDASNGYYLKYDGGGDDPPENYGDAQVFKTTNNGINWVSDFPSINFFNTALKFYSKGNVTYFTESGTGQTAYFYARKLYTNFRTFFDNQSVAGSFIFNGSPINTPVDYYSRGGVYPVWSESILNLGQTDERIFYKWNDICYHNYVSNYNFIHDGIFGNYFKSKLISATKDALSHITNNASPPLRIIRDIAITNHPTIIHQIHESMGGIFYSRSTNDGNNFSKEEVVDYTESTEKPYFNKNSSMNIKYAGGSPITSYERESNVSAVWERYNSSSGKTEICVSQRVKNIPPTGYHWERYFGLSPYDYLFTSFNSSQNHNSYPKIFVAAPTTYLPEDWNLQYIYIPLLKPGTTGNDLRILARHGSKSGDFTIDNNVSDIAVTASNYYEGFTFHFAYKKDNKIAYKKVFIGFELDNFHLTPYPNDDNPDVSSGDGQLIISRYTPDISLRNGLPVIAWQGSNLKTRTIVYEQGNEETMISNQYPIIARYKYLNGSTNGGTSWSTFIKYDSPPNITQQNPNVEGSKNKNAFLINYSVNNSIFRQNLKHQNYRDFYCYPNSFTGVDAKLVRGCYIDDFGQNSHPMLMTLKQEGSLYKIDTHSFCITNVANPNPDNYTNLEGIVRDSNIYYYFNLGPILVKNTFVSPEMGMDGPIYYTVQNPMEFNENMISRPFLLSNGDTLILGGTGKYDPNPNEHFFIKKYNVGLFRQSDNQIQQLLFSDTINTCDTIESEYLRGFIINDIGGGSDSFYVQLLIDSSDVSWGSNYSYSCVYSPDEVQGDIMSNYKSMVHFQNQGIKNNNNIPKTFSLSQNYPNPFNPATTIKYELPKDAFVTIKVYDIVGREIFTLVNENKQAGYYFVDFSGINFASGVYFYRIKAGDFSSVKRMVLIK